MSWETILDCCRSGGGIVILLAVLLAVSYGAMKMISFLFKSKE